jgi:hypothetical protein
MSGRTFSFEINRTSSAPPATLFRLETDGARWLMREKTVEYEQDRRHVYALIGPSTPAKDYRAEALFTPNASGGTDLRWRGSFTEGVRGTGPIMLAFLRAALQLVSLRMIKAAERETLTGPTG